MQHLRALHDRCAEFAATHQRRWRPGQEIIQKQGMVIIVSSMGCHRVIYTDGRPAIGGDAKFWFGNSRGRWDGDTLVVEVANLNGKGWLDYAGNFMTTNTRLVERWRLVDANTIDYEVTVEDPTTFSRPWKMNYPKRRDGTGPTGGPRALPGATTGLPSRVADNPYAKDAPRNRLQVVRRSNSSEMKSAVKAWQEGAVIRRLADRLRR